MRVLFFILASSLWGLAHFYVGRRLLTASRGPRWTHQAGWTLLSSMFVLTFVSFAARRTDWSDTALLQAIQWAVYIWMGAFVLLLFLVLARDVLYSGTLGGRWLWRRLQHKRASQDLPMPRSSTVGNDGPRNPERRKLFVTATNVGLVATASAGTALGYYEARRLARVDNVSVPIADLAPGLQGFRIAQISDIHVGPTITGEYLRAVVERVNTLEADMVAITGDLVDGYVDALRDQTAHLADLRTTYGTFYVNGNHEYYWDASGWAKEVERLGVKVLRNAHHVIERNGAKLLIAGVNDYSAARHAPEEASDLSKALQGAPPTDLRVLLAHQPKSVFAASTTDIDLQLSGHTHGGQFWPWSFFVGLAHPFSRGLNRYANLWAYCNRGTGYWGPPMRLGVPAEITLLTLERA